MPDHKSPGVHAIAARHMKYLLSRHCPFIEELRKIFNAFITKPETVLEARHLYEFKPVFIPKKDGSFRPIAICESILLIFHKILTKRLRGQTRTSASQFAFANDASTFCSAHAERMRSQGKCLTTIDITNAFNCVPHEAIQDALKRQGVSSNFREYLQYFLKMRHCCYADKIAAGVPQGDPLSMALFCLTINPVIEKLIEKGYELVAYADDIMIGHDSSVDSDTVIEQCRTLFLQYGLTIKSEKCHSTQKNETVTFMGL